MNYRACEANNHYGNSILLYKKSVAYICRCVEITFVNWCRIGVSVKNTTSVRLVAILITCVHFQDSIWLCQIPLYVLFEHRLTCVVCEKVEIFWCRRGVYKISELLGSHGICYADDFQRRYSEMVGNNNGVPFCNGKHFKIVIIVYQALHVPPFIEAYLRLVLDGVTRMVIIIIVILRHSGKFFGKPPNRYRRNSGECTAKVLGMCVLLG